MQQIIECVPNFSDGRRPDVYNAIADAIRAVPGTQVLDVSADPDHNRTVVTFVGDRAAVSEGAYQAIAKAAELINLDEHEGEHPRLGATDVCPFIPVKNATVEECVAIANELGQRVGDELGIAVYLYGHAAKSPARKKLSSIRKGQYELWQEEVAINPERKPDFGPAAPKPWGATTIGARPFLIAYNLYLNSDSVDIADAIARKVRFIGGGLRFVQAKGFLVEGQGQVSMNLTNFEKTAIFRVQEMVKREAAQYGLTVTKAELIGMIPQKALLDSAKWYLQLHDLEEDQVLELKLANMAADEAATATEPAPAPEADYTPHAFLEAVASNRPTPGGGSVAALAGALAAALTQMVAGLTAGRKKYADVNDQAEAIVAEAADLRAKLTEAIAADAAAFDAVMAAYRNKELSGEAKAAAIEEATINAGEVPLAAARLCLRAAQLAAQIAEVGNANAVSDAAAAGLMARAAVQAAGLNVRINGVGLQDQEKASAWAADMDQMEAEAGRLADGVLATAARRGGFN